MSSRAQKVKTTTHALACVLSFFILSAQALPEPIAPIAAEAAQAPAAKTFVAKSSLYELVEQSAAEIEYRAQVENVAGPLRIEVSAGRGVDKRRIAREFGARFLRRLRKGDVVVPSVSSPVRVRVTLSEERGTLWCTGTLEGGALLAPVHFAVSMPIDRELEMALGASSKRAGARWVTQRLGTMQNGVLDMLVLNDAGALSETLAVLSIDGIRFFRLGARVKEVGKHIRFEELAWPRALYGRLAFDEQKLLISTSAGHRLQYDVQSGVLSKNDSKKDFAMTQPKGEVLYAKSQKESPVFTGPLSTAKGEKLVGPARFRDLVLSPFHDETMIFIGDEGRLGALRKGRSKLLASQERAGDRLLLTDLDGAGDAELVTTLGVSYGESDELSVTTLDADLQSAKVVLRRRLSGGSIVALASGDLNFDGRDEVYAFEEFNDEAGVLWRIEYAQ